MAEYSFNHVFETNAIRKAIEKIGDPELMEMFEDEQKQMEAEANKEIEEMRKKGMFLE